MSFSDPVADLLTRIRNGQLAGHERVQIPASKFKSEIVRILKEEGYIKNYKIESVEGKPGQSIEVELKYLAQDTPVMSRIKSVSRPGRRVYVDKKHIPKVIGGMGTAILSTSRGVMTGHDARKLGVGGELIAEVW